MEVAQLRLTRLVRLACWLIVEMVFCKQGCDWPSVAETQEIVNSDKLAAFTAVNQEIVTGTFCLRTGSGMVCSFCRQRLLSRSCSWFS